eukprot:ctg_708.g349
MVCAVEPSLARPAALASRSALVTICRERACSRRASLSKGVGDAVQHEGVLDALKRVTRRCRHQAIGPGVLPFCERALLDGNARPPPPQRRLRRRRSERVGRRRSRVECPGDRCDSSKRRCTGRESQRQRAESGVQRWVEMTWAR